MTVLYILGTILKRWKRTWFVLYQNGDLRYFESPDSHEPEARIVVRAVCKAIQTAQMVSFIKNITYKIHFVKSYYWYALSFQIYFFYINVFMKYFHRVDVLIYKYRLAFLCRLWSIATHRDHFVSRLSVRLSHFSVTRFCHTFQSYVSQATHAFLGMLPLF